MIARALARPAIILPPWLWRDALGRGAKRLWDAPVRLIDGQFKPYQRLQLEANPNELPFVGAAGVSALTFKGYGHLGTLSANTSDLAMSYGTVDSGSAPAAGDLIIWIVESQDTGGSPIASPSGWERSTVLADAGASFYIAVFAKIASSTDISSPPNSVTAPTHGAAGMWIAYTVTGIVTTVAIGSFVNAWSTSGDPGNAIVTGSAVSGPLVIASLGNGTDGALGFTWAGATADQTSATIANQFNLSINDIMGKWKKYDSGPGDDVTLAIGDEGSNSCIIGAYITVV